MLENALSQKMKPLLFMVGAFCVLLQNMQGGGAECLGDGGSGQGGQDGGALVVGQERNEG